MSDPNKMINWGIKQHHEHLRKWMAEMERTPTREEFIDAIQLSFQELDKSIKERRGK